MLSTGEDRKRNLPSMNAVGLYVSTCRYILQCDPNNPETWGDLYRYLPYLRQALSCCVCTNILHLPMGPQFSICSHHVCQSCIGGRMRLKPSCSWCKGYVNFAENIQLSITVQCFKKLCSYLDTTPIVNHLANTTDNGNTNVLSSIIQEGINIRETSMPNFKPPVFKLFPPLPRRPTETEVNEATSDQTQSPSTEKSPRHRTDPKSPQINGTLKESEEEDSHDKYSPKQENQSSPPNTVTDLSISVAAVAAEHDYNKGCSPPHEVLDNEGIPKLRLRRLSGADRGSYENASKRSRHSSQTEIISEENSTVNSNGMASPERKRARSGSKKQKPSGCRCGLATPTPGKLTCCGQRCPCYSAYKGCNDCRCRGCRNPRKSTLDGLPKPQKDADTDSENSDIDIDN